MISEVRGQDRSSVMSNKRIQLVDKRSGEQQVMFQPVKLLHKIVVADFAVFRTDTPLWTEFVLMIWAGLPC